MSSTILVIHGPNLNLLGKREPEVYGHLTLEDINQQLIAQAQNAALSLDTFQSNWEGAIVDRIHQAQQENVQFIIINPAALTHTSVAVRDALLGVLFHLSKFIYRMSMLAKHLDIIRICPTKPLV